MPKKGKKGKDGKKGAKAKKDEKKEESITKMAERNSNIWEAKYKMSEFQKDHYRETSKQLVEENNSLVDYMKQNEKDTIEVVSYLRKLDSEKDTEITSLKDELKSIHGNYQKEKDVLMQEFTTKLNEYQEVIDKKTSEFEMVSNELNQLKEFRKKKIQMQRELEEIKEAMILNEKEHKEQTLRIEEKFFEEKMRLQIEANKKIEELAEKAHDAAIKNLDDVTRNIYKENVQLTESFKLNGQEIERLKKLNKALSIENQKLKEERDGNNDLVNERVQLAAKQAKLIKDLQTKTEILEKSLSQVIKEFEIERLNIIEKCKLELDSTKTELDKVKNMLDLRNKEMNKVKKLAKNILEQRSDIERFFLDSLDYVKQQIITNRNEYRKNANNMYNNRMLAAFKGESEYPKVRTFSKKFDAFSTNNVYKDLEQAEKWFDVNEMVDLVDLTWEQKEQVLRELFARINGTKVNKPKNDNDNRKTQKSLALTNSSNNKDGSDISDFEESPNYVNYLEKIPAKKSPKSEGTTFLTQTHPHIDEFFSNRSTVTSTDKLPVITTTHN